jgi:hypothetical protein
MTMRNAYVADIQTNEIVIREVGDSCEDLVATLGARRTDGSTLRLSYSDRTDLARLLTRLRDLGVAMGGGQHGWPPAAVFSDLRSNGLVAGPYDELIFSGPSTWRRTTRSP